MTQDETRMDGERVEALMTLLADRCDELGQVAQALRHVSHALQRNGVEAEVREETLVVVQRQLRGWRHLALASLAFSIVFFPLVILLLLLR